MLFQKIDYLRTSVIKKIISTKITNDVNSHVNKRYFFEIFSHEKVDIWDDEYTKERAKVLKY